MSKYIFILIIVGVFGNTYSQDYKLTFSYDAAGNQILRSYVCINCNKSASKIKGSIQEEKSLDEKIDEIDQTNTSFSLFPNPVDSMLNIEWENGESSFIKEILLFTLNGVLIHQRKFDNSQTRTSIDCSNLPTATYIMKALYSDGTLQAHRVIKN